ncbi:MAG: acyl-CoA carboxylase subunit beta [Dehalococcoidia bacterium]|nr:acyl-CoA carboxylase subunit beta [Dehalococcoidia bacterium]
MEERIAKLRAVRQKAIEGGGQDKIARQHERGKLTARERLAHLLDPDSFVEHDMLVGHETGGPGDGVVSGHGMVDGRVVSVYSQDATVAGGTIGALHGRKIYKAVERALEMRVPFIGLNDSPGARAESKDQMAAQYGVGSEKTGRSIFMPHVQASGVVPQISAILGSCAGIAVYAPALTDFIFIVDRIGQMFITGPRVAKSVLGEDVTAEALGGARIHSQVSGVVDFRTRSEEECFTVMRKLLGFLPPNNEELPPVLNGGDDPDRLDDDISAIVPSDPRKAYDTRQIIARLADNGDFLEVKAEFAREVVVGFGRLDSHTVGFVANQPMVAGGALTVDSSDKQARFIRFCDAFNIPLVLLVDTPAYMPGTRQEQAGIIRHGAKVPYALCEATVPRIVVMVRKCYGGGWLGMGVIAGLGTDLVLAWPSAELGIMGAEQTVDLIHDREIAAAEHPQELREQLIREYREKYSNPLALVSSECVVGVHIDDVIEPRETRRRLIREMRLLRTKKRPVQYPRKHANMPL